MLSADHRNAVRIRDVYTKWFAGVGSPMIQFLADDFVYHLPGRHLGGGEVRGLADLLERGRRYGASYDEPPYNELLSVVADDVFGMTIERYRAKRFGRALDQKVCVVWRLEGEYCQELWSLFQDQAACDAFWG